MWYFTRYGDLASRRVLLACLVAGCSSASHPGSTDAWSTLPNARIDVSDAEASGVSIVVDRLGGAILHDDGSAVVADASSNRITFIDANAQVRRVTGGVGAGPGEFEALNAPLPCGDGHVLFWDQRLRRATRWNMAGDLVESRSVATGPTNASVPIGAARDCRSVQLYTWDPRSRPTTGSARMRAALLSVPLDGISAPDTLLPLEGDEMELLSTPSGRPQHARVLFSSTPLVAGRAGRLVRADGGLPRAEVFRSASAPAERVEWSETPRLASDAELALIDASRETFRQRFPEQAPFIPAARDQARRQVLPAIDRILIGADSSVWLRRYRITDTGLGTDVDPSRETWLVIPPERDARYVVAVGRGLSLVAASSTYVLVSMADDGGDKVVRVALPQTRP